MSTQQTLTGEDAEFEEMELPGTFVECDQCGDVMLRSQRFDHEHEVSPASIRTAPVSDDEQDEDDVDEKVGSWWDITLEYNVTYRFKLPAYSKHRAEEIAKDWKLDAKPADSIHVHTDRREGSDIFESDAPDDWDKYGSEPLWQAMERLSDDADTDPEQEGSVDE